MLVVDEDLLIADKGRGEVVIVYSCHLDKRCFIKIKNLHLENRKCSFNGILSKHATGLKRC